MTSINVESSALDLISSQDGGTTWIKSPVSATAVEFKTNLVGWAGGGAQTYVWKTTDGGITWVRKFLSYGDLGIAQISFANATYGWIAGTSEFAETTIYRTEDAGETWSYDNPTSSIPNFVTGLSTYDAGGSMTAWMVGENGQVKRRTLINND
jgi:photosystem II stability/assembly factor-like uncharacterized protein